MIAFADGMTGLAMLAQEAAKGDSDRALYNKEFQSLSSYIADVQTKDFNGVSLFSGSGLNLITGSEGGLFAMSGISAEYILLAPPQQPRPRRVMQQILLWAL